MPPLQRLPDQRALTCMCTFIAIDTSPFSRAKQDLHGIEAPLLHVDFSVLTHDNVNVRSTLLHSYIGKDIVVVGVHDFVVN